MHLSGAVRDECRPVAAKLGAYVRGGLARRDAAAVAVHLHQCADCEAVFAELSDVNVALRSIVAPLILGPAATACLAAATAKGSARGGRDRRDRFARAEQPLSLVSCEVRLVGVYAVTNVL